ncbi:MAG: hypothetical protein AAGA55_05490 [Planctomycetota bacterium]
MPSPRITTTAHVWYLMPSANPANAARSVPAWQDQGYRVAVLQDRTRFDIRCDALLTRERYPGWAGSINALFREVVPPDCRVVVAGGDDMFPDPDRRAPEIAGSFLDHFAGDFGVMQPTGDDFEATRTICGSPWLGRSWMERMYQGRGGLCEAYHQQWADDELFWVSRCAGRFLPRPDLTQRHDHFLRSDLPAPQYWVESAAGHDESDCLTFIARSRAGFPGAAPRDEPGLLDIGVFKRAYRGRAENAYRERYAALDTGPAERLGEALDRCDREGASRVAIYGAGQHTHRAGAALRSPPVDILAIIDDDPARIGGRLWNYPVVSLEHALGMGLDAVVLSSDAMEHRLMERAAAFLERGVEVRSLYTHDARPIGAA